MTSSRAPSSDTDAPPNDGRIRSGKLAGRTLMSGILVLAIPVLFQQLMQASVGMADKVFAGQLPAGIRLPALDAIGIGSYVGWFIGIAMTGLGIGGQAIIARGMGSGNLEQSHRALGQAMGLSFAWGAAVGVLLWFFAAPVAAMCGLSAEATAMYVDYIRTLSIGMPLAGVMMVGAMCMYGAGETTAPSAIAIVVNIVNIICSWALSGADLQFGSWALVNPFEFDLHVRGIAAGTSISYFFGALLTGLVLRRGVKDLRLEARDMVFDRTMISRVVRIGMPNFFEGISMWAVNLIVLSFIGVIAARTSEGQGLQGAHIIAVQWEAFSFLPGFAIGTAAGALAGQYLGAGNPKMAERAVLVCTGLASIVMGGLGILFITQGEFLTALVSTEPVHLELTPKLLRICGGVQIFFAITMVVRQGLRGVGDTKWTFLITTISSYGVRMPACYLFGVVLGYGLEGIWYGLCGEFVVRAALFCSRFFHGGWKRIRV